MFEIDGLEWTVGCEIERISKITASEISGMLLDLSYLNDVLGTWLRYEIVLKVPYGAESAYTAIYEILTNPVNYHTFVMPYNQGTVTFQGRVEEVHDVPYKLRDRTYWAETKFTAVASEPTKRATLQGVLSS